MSNPYLKKVIIEIVENQLAANAPPITKKTLNRLLAAGYSREQAVEMIGTVAITEIWEVMQNDEAFDLQRYTTGLKNLH